MYMIPQGLEQGPHDEPITELWIATASIRHIWVTNKGTAYLYLTDGREIELSVEQWKYLEKQIKERTKAKQTITVGPTPA